MHECLSYNNLNGFQYTGLSNSHLFFDELKTINNLEHYIFTSGNTFISFIYIGNKNVDINNINSFIDDNKHLFIVHKEDTSPAIYSRNLSKIELNIYFKNGYLHRESDLPAVQHDKISYWYKHGFLHRINAPAMTEFSYNHEEHFSFEVFGFKITEEHFENFEEKTENVNINGIEHEKYSNSFGQEIYFLNGKIHKEDDSPAYISQDTKIWYKNGIIHRQFKPAVIVAFSFQDLYIKKGRKLDKEEVKREIISGNVNLF